MSCSPWTRRAAAQRGCLCFKDRHSMSRHREEFRSTFGDCTMEFRALGC